MTTFEEYSNEKYIAFIDILGFSKLICEVKTERQFNSINIFNSMMHRIMKIIESPEKPIEELPDEYKHLTDMKVTFISDCIILTSDNPLLVYSYVSIIQALLIPAGYLTRGYLTKGKVCHEPENNLIWGEGYIRAYNGEKNAIYPRVVIDSKIIEDMTQADVKSIQKDFDGLYYVHYLHENILKAYIMLKEFDRIELIKDLIKEKIEEFKDNENILKKYLWLENYSNKFLK